MKKIGLFIFSLNMFFISLGQSVELSLISSAGGEFRNENVALNYALGEIAVESFKTQKLFVTQGFLQSTKQLRISVEEKQTELVVEIYPNPANHDFNIAVSLDEWFDLGSDLQFKLIDVNGKLIQRDNLYQPITSININQLMSGTYYVIISNSPLDYKEVFVLQKVKK